MRENNNRDKKRRQRYVMPFNQLSDEQREKELKINKRGYQYCGHTLRMIHDIDQAVYNPTLDLIFENRQAESAYYKELRWGSDKFNKKKKRVA